MSDRAARRLTTPNAYSPPRSCNRVNADEDRPPGPTPRTCPTCGRFDTQPHHVPRATPSHHLACCPRTCGAHWTSMPTRHDWTPHRTSSGAAA